MITRWKYVVDAIQGRIQIEAQRLARTTRELKDSQATVINAWQQLGRMAILARSCSPLRDLENDIERQKRQNVSLEKRLKGAQGPHRIAAIRSELLIGKSKVEEGTLLRADLLRVSKKIQSAHLKLLLDWYGNSHNRLERPCRTANAFANFLARIDRKSA